MKPATPKEIVKLSVDSYNQGYAAAIEDAANVVQAGTLAPLDERCIEISNAYFKAIKALLSRGSR